MMNQIKEFLALLKFNTVTWLSIITLCELFLTYGLKGGAGLFLMYGCYKIVSK